MDAGRACGILATPDRSNNDGVQEIDRRIMCGRTICGHIETMKGSNRHRQMATDIRSGASHHDGYNPGGAEVRSPPADAAGVAISEEGATWSLPVSGEVNPVGVAGVGTTAAASAGAKPISLRLT
jgi:hypothetical protein